MRTLALLAACLLAGCAAGPRLDLGPEWAPLVAVEERDLPGVSSTAITTLGTVAVTAHLEEWLAAHPEPHLGAVLRHEQEHARRQQATGLTTWLARYLTDASFAWQEERRGWALEILWLRDQGVVVDVEAVAMALDGYRVPGGDLVSLSDARVWVASVLAGGPP